MQWSPGFLTRLAPFVLLSFTLAGACARPLVDEGGPAIDAGADTGALIGDGEEPAAEPEIEAGGSDEPDAAQVEPDAAGGTPDASCPDRDRDTVCDAKDNCPDVANTNQADSNADGTGDACSSSAPDAGGGVGGGTCNAEAVPASVVAGDATFSDVRVNGSASPVKVSKGQRLNVALNYAFRTCSFAAAGQPRSLTIGIEGQSAGDCRILIEVPCPTEVNASTTLSVEAPKTVGPAYVVVAGGQGQGFMPCSGSLSSAKRVAALCVE